MQPSVMPKGASHHELRSGDYSRIAQDLQIRKVQVEAVVALLDEGNTVPFITRYRKERTGGLNEDIIRQIQARVGLLRQLAERKQTILRSIEGQGKLTDDLRNAILAADTSKRLEDLYLPYKPKKRTLATTARERGLEPLALAVWHRDLAVNNLAEVLSGFVNPEKELPTPEDVRTGVQHILAEMVSETADVRAIVRSVLWETGRLKSTKSDKLAEGQGLEYKDYFQFTEPVRQIPPHRILALNRGEKENALKVSMEWNTEAVQSVALRGLAEAALRQASAPPPPPAPPPAPEPAPVPPADQPTVVVEGPPPTEAPPAPIASPPAAPPPPPTYPTGPGEGEPLSPDSPYRTPHAAFMKVVVEDALNRLLLPSLEREIRRELTEEAEAHAVGIFARNLRSLLLQPPLHGRRVLAIDPGFRTGCKIAALDETGNLLEDAVIFPHGSHGKKGGHGAPATPPAAAPPAAAPAPPVVAGPPDPATAPSAAPEAIAAPPAEPVAAEATAPETTPPQAAVPTPEPAQPPTPPPPPPPSKREEAKAKLYD
ncbi:MAG TPA: Tex-like N-terminal domain-containing protein, partial [Gemmataceae bacterium]|nr:Tex-like N-terminal domain-containing protein [Gemmataceae bacterium]